MRVGTSPATSALIALICALGVLCATSPEPAKADGAAQVPGFDISWPQCSKASFPPGPVAFAIIGINGGKPFTPNPCFRDQYRWAQRIEVNPAVYVNMDYPKPDRIEAQNGPYGVCTATDEWCRAYNFGYANGREVITRAGSLLVTPSFWWLDVETASYWSADPTYNAQVIRGTLDYFKEKKLPVGVYGTPRQWKIIAGPYVPGVPVWTAGAQGIEMAASRCADASFAFAGGSVRMVQYYDYGFDTNYACPGGHPLTLFPRPDPLGRPGPSGRSLSPSGSPLPRWQVIPMVAGEGR